MPYFDLSEVEKMIEIKTLQDITSQLKSRTLSKGFAKYLEKYFQELYQSLGDGVAIEKFSLESSGHLVILDAEKDDCRNLSEVGLNEEEGGLLGCCIEFVNHINISTNEQYYQAAVPYNNEFMMLFYYPINSTYSDEEIINHLSEHIVEQ